MTEFPATVYRYGSMFEWDKEWFDCLVVYDREELDSAVAGGWALGKPVPEAMDDDETIVAEQPRPRGRPRKVSQ